MAEENQGQEGQEEKDTGIELEETGDMDAQTVVAPTTPMGVQSTSSSNNEVVDWAPEPDHGSATRMLVSANATEEDVDVQVEKSRTVINLLLVLLMILVVAGAFVTLQKTDGFYSEDGAGLGGIIDLKEALARHQEQEFTYEELKKQKRFGTLTISSEPKGAMICTDKATLSRINLDDAAKAKLKKCPNPNARGEELVQLTTAPGKIAGVDTAHLMTLTAQREGYQDFPLYIGTHLWPVNQGTEAQYIRVFKMTPQVCNRWQTNDSQMGTVTFYNYLHCEGYVKGVKGKKDASRTTDGCTCNPEVIDTSKKKKKKK